MAPAQPHWSLIAAHGLQLPRSMRGEPPCRGPPAGVEAPKPSGRAARLREQRRSLSPPQPPTSSLVSHIFFALLRLMRTYLHISAAADAAAAVEQAAIWQVLPVLSHLH